MKPHLLIDFGSTHTKLTLVDLDKLEILGSSKAPTTVKTNILNGYHDALNKLRIDNPSVEGFSGITACSSAAGGLKMAAIGLVEELTVEAAKRACLGAGAKVELVFSHHITKNEIHEIEEADIDIILLAGGTNGGNSETILYNAKKLSKYLKDIPIVVAGNKDAQDDIEEVFEDAGIEYYIVDNVMPKLNALNVDSAKEVIRQIFISKIIEAKGIKKAEEEIGEIIMPTPQAVLQAAELLSKGFEEVEGLGDIIVVDIGGATTDVHTVGSGFPKRSEVIYKGLEEPFAKRTVEGDLGMRYSAPGVVDAVTEYKFKQYMKKEADVKTEIKKRVDDVEFIPETEEEIEFDTALARVCTDVSVGRHVGHIDKVYTPLGDMYYQTGKDLTDVKYVIGTGGILVHTANPDEVLKEVEMKTDNSLELRPKSAKFLIDKDYIMSAMGLLSQKYPKEALKIMKKYIVK